MSLLHRSILAQIMAGLEPVVETAITAFVPDGAALTPLVQMGATVAESELDGPAPAAVAVAVASDPTKVLPAGYVSPLPAPAPAAAAQPAPAPATQPSAGQTGAATAAAAAPLTAAEVIAALMQTLQALSARA